MSPAQGKSRIPLGDEKWLKLRRSNEGANPVLVRKRDSGIVERMKWCCAVFLLLAACRDPNDAGPASFDPVVSSRDLWSGGELRISEAYFRQTDPLVLLGA